MVSLVPSVSRYVAFSFLMICCCFPFFHLLGYLDQIRWQWNLEFGFALRGSVSQAFLSALFSMAMGALGAWGLLGLRQGPLWRVRLVQAGGLLPGFLPPLLVLTLGMRLFSDLGAGLWGVVFFHGLMNIGLASVLIEQLILVRALPWIQLAIVEGVPSGRTLLFGVLPNLRKELAGLFLFFFLLFFSSFSIPFILGGARYGGVEVFLYELIFLFRDWGQALGLSMGLMVFFLVMALFLQNQIHMPLFRRLHSGALPIGFPVLGIVPMAPLLLILVCGLVGGAWNFKSLFELFQLDGAQGSLIVGLGTGLFVFILSSLVLYCFVSPLVGRWLFFTVPPGWMIIAFSFYLMEGGFLWAGYLKTIGALGILFLPVLYRLGLYQAVETLRGQVEVSRVMGSSWAKIFFLVIWPQSLSRIAFLSGVAGAWAVGDFAVSSVLLPGSSTLALQMKELLTSYRLGQAEMLILPLSMILIVVFSIFQGLGYVCRPKSL